METSDKRATMITRKGPGKGKEISSIKSLLSLHDSINSSSALIPTEKNVFIFFAQPILADVVVVEMNQLITFLKDEFFSIHSLSTRYRKDLQS
jgi:hypothetical protein